MNLKNIKTRNGQTIECATQVGDKILGIVNGKAMSWNLDGRRTNNNRSVLDIYTPKYLIIRKWGSRYSVTESNTPVKGNGIVKIVEL